MGTTKIPSTVCVTALENKQVNTLLLRSASSLAPSPVLLPPPPLLTSVIASVVPVTTLPRVVVPTERPPLWQSARHWKFNWAQITEVVWAISKHVGLYEEALFAKIAPEFLPRLQKLTAQHLQGCGIRSTWSR